MNKTVISNADLLPEVARIVAEGRSVTLPLRGYSMRPFLENDRDKAVLSRPEELRVGDVVLAEVSPRRYVLHRIVAMDGQNIELLGDGNIMAEHCTASDVMAVATAFFRKGSLHPDLTSGLKWRTYSWVWMRLRPIRRYLLYIHRHFIIRQNTSKA